jgi:hypothetical protein
MTTLQPAVIPRIENRTVAVEDFLSPHASPTFILVVLFSYPGDDYEKALAPSAGRTGLEPLTDQKPHKIDVKRRYS